MKEFVSKEGERLNKQQGSYLSSKAVEAYMAIGEAADKLSSIGVHILHATIAVNIPGVELPKVLNVARPSMKTEALVELLQLIGGEAQAAADQAAIIEIMAALKLKQEIEDTCENCPDKDTCDERSKNATIQ